VSRHFFLLVVGKSRVRDLETDQETPAHVGEAAMRLPARGQDTIAFEAVPKRPSRVDLELGEDLAQVVLDRVGADEEPGTDLAVREAFAGHGGYLGFRRRQITIGLDTALAGGLPGSAQLESGPFSERLHAHRVERP